MFFCCDNPEVPDLRQSAGSALLVGFSSLRVGVFSGSPGLYLENREGSLGYITSAEKLNSPWKILQLLQASHFHKTLIFLTISIFPSKYLPVLCRITP